MNDYKYYFKISDLKITPEEKKVTIRSGSREQTFEYERLRGIEPDVRQWLVEIGRYDLKEAGETTRRIIGRLEGNTPTENQLKILQDKNLFNRITEKEFDKKVVGEYGSRKTIFLLSCGRYVENAEISSFNLLVNSASSSGKDYITTKILEIFSEKDIVKRTRISPTALTYWHHDDPTWTWNGRVLYLEDVSQQVLNSDVLKCMCSSGSNATITVNNKAEDFKVNGKPVVITTTATSNPTPEIQRRFNIVQLDETQDQTKAILKRQGEYVKEGKKTEYSPDILGALSFLKRVKVKVPFGDKIATHFPHKHITMRTHFSRFLDYIKASCSLHQYQRKRDAEGYYLAEKGDYKVAREVLLATTSNPLMISLPTNEIKLLDIFKELGVGQSYSISDILPKATFVIERTLRRKLNKLVECGLLQVDTEDRDEGKKPVLVYSVVDLTCADIPEFEELQKNVN